MFVKYANIASFNYFILNMAMMIEESTTEVTSSFKVNSFQWVVSIAIIFMPSTKLFGLQFSNKWWIVRWILSISRFTCTRTILTCNMCWKNEGNVVKVHIPNISCWCASTKFSQPINIRQIITNGNIVGIVKSKQIVRLVKQPRIVRTIIVYN